MLFLQSPPLRLPILKAVVKGAGVNEEQRREYDSLIRGIIDQAEAMREPDEEEMIYDKINDLQSKLDELGELIDRVYA